jgi:hypothetical protein
VKKTRTSESKNVIGERVLLARLAMHPPVSQEDLSGWLAAKGVQITQTGISKLNIGSVTSWTTKLGQLQRFCGFR